ncbi:MAG: cupin domain-containing protein [Salinivirgaceae bacterium]|nr:cupin domain-containing protein [Salinivirgaceae bacterium]
MDIIVKKLTEAEYRKMGVQNWPIWEKEISLFDWRYDEKEQFFLIEGEVKIKTKEAEYNVQPGDFVVCPKGLVCEWKITKYVKKHYQFVGEP